MSTLKIASFNIEWMVNLFRPNEAAFWPAESKSTGLGRKPNNVPLVCERIAGTIRAVDPDILGIQEGPPLQEQLALFVRNYLDDAYDVYSMPDGRQSNHALVRKSLPLKITQVPSSHAIYRHLERKVEYYTWGEIKKARMEKFTRKPVVLQLDTPDGAIEIMVFHTKSKISKLKNRNQWITREKDAVLDALRSRQKLSAEMAAVRRYLSHAILSKRATGIILMGDLNDGPLRDIFEEQFLIHSIVDELRGGFHREAALMHHTISALEDKNCYTAKFPDPTRDGKIVTVLLDHIMATTGIITGKGALRLRKGSGKIEHDAYDEHTTNNGRNGDDRPSDHRPVSAIFHY